MSNLTPSDAPSTIFVMPDLTTSRSTSSTGFRARAPSELDADLADALELWPEHLSCYELEAKPGTRFTHVHGHELERQADAMESYFELVVDRLTGAGYRWYETANFCRISERDLRSRHNLGYWLGRDYLALGIGAVSTIGGTRWRNTPRLAGYIQALERETAPDREIEPLSNDVRRRERVMLGLRLDEPWRWAISPRSSTTVPCRGSSGSGSSSTDADRHTLALTSTRPFPRRRGHRRPARLERR